MNSAWRIAAELLFIYNPAPMSAFIAQTNAAKASMASLQASAVATGNAVAAANTRIAASAVAMRRALGGAMVLAGVGTLALVGDALKHASSLQTTLASINIAAGNATAAQKLALGNLLPGMAHETGLLDQDLAGQVVRAILGSGFVASQVLGGTPGHTIADMFAKFADVRYRQTSGREGILPTVESTAGMIHAWGAYQPTEVSRMLETLNRVTTSFNAPLGQLLRQMTYFTPQARAHGVGFDAMVNTMNVLGPQGMFANRGGTGINQMLLDMTKAPKMTGHTQLIRDAALQSLGIYDSHMRNRFMQGDKLDYTGLVDKLRLDKATMDPTKFSNLLQNMFPSANALRTIQALLEPKGQQQAARLAAKEGGVLSIEAQQNLYLSLLGPSTKQLMTDFSSLLSRMVTPTILALLTKFVQGIDAIVVSITDLFTRVPWTATLTTVTLLATGLGLVAGGLAMLLSVATSGPLLALGSAISALMSPAALAVAAVVGVSAAFLYFRSRPAELGVWVAKIQDFFMMDFIPKTVALMDTWGLKIAAAFGNSMKLLWDFATNPANVRLGMDKYLDKVSPAYRHQKLVDEHRAVAEARGQWGDVGEYGAHIGRPNMSTLPRGAYAPPAPVGPITASVQGWQWIFSDMGRIWHDASKPITADTAKTWQIEIIPMWQKNIELLGTDMTTYFNKTIFPNWRSGFDRLNDQMTASLSQMLVQVRGLPGYNPSGFGPPPGLTQHVPPPAHVPTPHVPTPHGAVGTAHGSPSPVVVNNTFHIKSTDPKKSAAEVKAIYEKQQRDILAHSPAGI